MNLPCCLLFRSIVVYDSLWPHGLQHIRLPCSSQSPNEVHVHGISDAVQPSHPLMPSSPSALNLSQNQDFFNESAVRNQWPKYWSWSSSALATWCEKSWLSGKDLDSGKDWGQKEKRATEDEMIGWHHWLNGHEFEQTLGDGEGQHLWGCTESDTTEAT